MELESRVSSRFCARRASGPNGSFGRISPSVCRAAFRGVRRGLLDEVS